MNKGVLMYCFNTDQVAYHRVADVSIALAKQQLGLPISVVTNRSTLDSWHTRPDVNFIVTYKETSPKCSYVREQAGFVVEVREKRVISNDATIGFYHWAHTRDFFQDAEQMIADDHKENGEYYVAPVYNYSIQRGLKVKKYAIDNKEFWPVGTPDDFMYFNGNTTFFD